MRRFAEAGGRANLLHAAALLELAPNDAARQRLLHGFEQAYQGRTLVGLPEELVRQLAQSGGGSLALRVRQGQPDALREAVALLNDPQGDAEQRATIARVLGEVGNAETSDALLAAALDDPRPQVRIAALTALQSFTQERIAVELLRRYDQLPPAAQEVAMSLLASRPQWSLALVHAAQQDPGLRQSIPPHIVSRLLLHHEESLQQLVRSLWKEGASAPAAQQTTAEVAALEELLGQGSGNPYNGKRLYAESCGKCHRLFQQGGQVGPDLTAFQRQDLVKMLVNVVNPSLEIREGYETFVIQTDDGRMLSGFIADQDAQIVALRGTDGQSIQIPRSQIEEMHAIPRSVMPDGLLSKFSEQEIRDLFAYLRHTALAGVNQTRLVSTLDVSNSQWEVERCDAWLRSECPCWLCPGRRSGCRPRKRLLSPSCCGPKARRAPRASPRATNR